MGKGLGKEIATYDGFRGIEQFTLSPDLDVVDIGKTGGKKGQAECEK